MTKSEKVQIGRMYLNNKATMVGLDRTNRQDSREQAYQVRVEGFVVLGNVRSIRPLAFWLSGQV